jgi:5-methylthioadenosine/S-adenosylhomocysteine deaminase
MAEPSPSGQIVTSDWVLPAWDAPPIRDGAVRIVGTGIDAVGPAASLVSDHPGDSVVTTAGSCVLPGFVNAHTHLYGTLAHGIPVDPVDSFWSFLADYWWPKVEDRLDHDMIVAATEWVCAEMLRTGTTSFYDIVEAPHALPGVLLAQKDAVDRAGLRGILSFEATERVSAANGVLGLAENEALIEACRVDASSIVSGAMCFHTTFTCPETFIRSAFALGAEHDVFVHAHVNEGVHEGLWNERERGMRTFEWYARMGLLSSRFLASQCVQLSSAEVDLVASSGVRVSHMPMANGEVGGGIAPIPELLARGVTVGLGSDGYVNDMFEEMRSAFLLHKARLLDPAAMPGRDVLRMATQGGADALGLSNVGRLEPGWLADLQVVNMRMPTPVTAHNLIDQLVLWRSGRHVTDVMVHGTWRVQGGEVLGADIEKLRARTIEQAARLWSAA